MVDPSTTKKLYFAGCVVAQVLCITALVLQGMGLQQIYDSKHLAERNGVDTTGYGYLTHICLFISVIVFGSLKQLMVWPGLLRQKFGLLAGAGSLDFLDVILCICLFAIYGNDTSLPAYVGIISGFLSLSTSSKLSTILGGSG